MPLVSSSSKDPISKASAALTSPLGGIKGGVYYRHIIHKIIINYFN